MLAVDAFRSYNNHISFSVRVLDKRANKCAASSTRQQAGNQVGTQEGRYASRHEDRQRRKQAGQKA